MAREEFSTHVCDFNLRDLSSGDQIWADNYIRSWKRDPAIGGISLAISINAVRFPGTGHFLSVAEIIIPTSHEEFTILERFRGWWIKGRQLEYGLCLFDIRVAPRSNRLTAKVSSLETLTLSTSCLPNPPHSKALTPNLLRLWKCLQMALHSRHPEHP